MCELTNQEAYDYYHDSIKKTAKDYWFKFLKERANRRVAGAQEYVNKIERCENKDK